MKFQFNKREFDIISKYGNFEDLEKPYELFSKTYQIEIDDTELRIFQSIISDISIVFGMDENQNNMTDFGYKVLDIYDKVYFQIHKLKAPD